MLTVKDCETILKDAESRLTPHSPVAQMDRATAF